MPEGFVEVDPQTQWCVRHWDDVLDTLDGPEPINGFLATIGIFKEWLNIMAAQMGDAFPRADEPERATALFEEHRPLCCKLEDGAREAIYSTCIVPERFRTRHPRIGHLLHLQEEMGAMLVQVESIEDAPTVPAPGFGGLN